MKIRISIIEDDLEYRAELVKSLQVAGFEICAVYYLALNAIRDVVDCAPDIVLVDIGLPDESGLTCIRELKTRNPETQFVVLTVLIDDEAIFSAIQMGASGYICKTDSYSRIAEALIEIKNGQAFLSASVARRICEHIQKNPILREPSFGLTKREQEIAVLLALGKSYKEIAEDLYSSAETVRRHIHNIYKKLSVRNRTEALIALDDPNQGTPRERH